MSADFKLQKVGSLWKGQIVSISENGDLITNIPTEELESFAKAAKVWIELGNPPRTIRGLAASRETVEKGRLFAVNGSNGFLEISLRDGSAAEFMHLSVASPISIHFRI